jgi:hypothetical protein
VLPESFFCFPIDHNRLANFPTEDIVAICVYRSEATRQLERYLQSDVLLKQWPVQIS